MRRLHVPLVRAGPLALTPAEAHHARDVLRLTEGAAVEVFDAAGRTGAAAIRRCTPREVVLEVQEVREPSAGGGLPWTIASAIPKGSRVDWMVEKLSELGAARFIPLRTQRGVVLPEGQGKRQRWQRLAAEAAKQSHRIGIMQIDELTDVADLVGQLGAGSAGWYLSTAPDTPLVLDLIATIRKGSPLQSLTFLIGPEGGWTDAERAAFDAAGITAVSLGPTILRIETAAVAAAVLASCVVGPAPGP